MSNNRPPHLRRLSDALGRAAQALEHRMTAADFEECANDPAMPDDYRARMAAMAAERRNSLNHVATQA